MKHGLKLLACVFLLVAISCSKREAPVSTADEEEWDSIRPMADVPTNSAPLIAQVPAPSVKEAAPVAESVADVGPVEKSPKGKKEKAARKKDVTNILGLGGLVEKAGTEVDFDALNAKLNHLAGCERSEGETFLTGDALHCDYERHFIRLERNVVVSDDRGELQSNALSGSFSETNSLNAVEADGDVRIRIRPLEGQDFTEGDTFVSGDNLLLDHARRFVRLDRNVTVSNEHGMLETDLITAGFSESNSLTVAEADGNVRITVNPVEGREYADSVTYVTGDNLLLDYVRRFARLDQNVKIRNDRGEMNTTKLIGRFSVSNTVDLVEAEGGVVVTAEDRNGRADSAAYSVTTGKMVLNGGAELRQAENMLSGGRIQFWLEGGRRMICEPDARLVIHDAENLDFDGKTVKPSEKPAGSDEKRATAGDTEITADRIVFDEKQHFADFDGNVKVRDPRAKMDCGKVRLHLKDGNEIDWIEARSEVIIQVNERKALAEQASYFVEEGKFVLEGSPKITEGQNIMTGDKISFWRDEQRMVCEPRARVLIYPDENMRQQFLKDLKD